MDKTLLHKYNRNGYIITMWAGLSYCNEIVIHYEITTPTLITQKGYMCVFTATSMYEIYSDLTLMPNYIQNFTIAKVKEWGKIIYDFRKGYKYKGHRLCSHKFLSELYQKWSVYDERYDLNR